MSYESNFKRYEVKYILGERQTDALMDVFEDRMELDSYGETTIRNIYLDTDTFLMARRSIEKPVYKEKVRLRSYSEVYPQDNVFVELKKKYDSVVYKRRTEMELTDALHWLCCGGESPVRSQISDEIGYCMERYGSLAPAMLITYSRRAYNPVDGSDLRVTIDRDILARNDNIRLNGPLFGMGLLERGQVLMEIKTKGNIPMWLVDVMRENDILLTSFSKYGTAYRLMSDFNMIPDGNRSKRTGSRECTSVRRRGSESLVSARG